MRLEDQIGAFTLQVLGWSVAPAPRHRGRDRAEPVGAGVDLRDWAVGIIALPCWTDEQRAVMGGYTFRVREYARPPRGRWGYCDYDRRVVSVSVWPGCRGCDVVEVLLHELVHAAGYRRHDVRFRRAMLVASHALTGVEVPSGRTLWDEAEEVRVTISRAWLYLVRPELAGMETGVVPYAPAVPSGVVG